MNSPYTDYRIKVHTKEHIEKVVKESDGRLSVHTKMPAENGLANLDIIRLVSLYFEVAQTKVMIMRGHTEPNKTIRVYFN